MGCSLSGGLLWAAVGCWGGLLGHWPSDGNRRVLGGPPWLPPDLSLAALWQQEQGAAQLTTARCSSRCPSVPSPTDRLRIAYGAVLGVLGDAHLQRSDLRHMHMTGPQNGLGWNQTSTSNEPLPVSDMSSQRGMGSEPMFGLGP